MDEYIEREAAKRAACDALELYRSEYDAIEESIDKVPAADVAPVWHGRWQAIKSNGIGGTGRCSCCEKAIYGYRAYNYCPNCGAKMDGGFDNG